MMTFHNLMVIIYTVWSVCDKLMLANTKSCLSDIWMFCLWTVAVEFSLWLRMENSQRIRSRQVTWQHDSSLFITIFSMTWLVDVKWEMCSQCMELPGGLSMRRGSSERKNAIIPPGQKAHRQHCKFNVFAWLWERLIMWRTPGCLLLPQGCCSFWLCCTAVKLTSQRHFHCS